MANPAPEKPARDWSKYPWNLLVVVFGLIALVLLARMALDELVTANPDPKVGGRLGASDAIALITASGAILTGIIGAYFGVNIASKSANAAQSTQAQANEAQKEANKITVAAAASLDPTSETAQNLIQNVTK